MSEQELTPWFVNGEKPVRPGVYQQRNCYQEVGFQRWYRGLWMLWFSTPEAAAHSTDPAADACQNDPWRGLARPPKAKP